MRAVPSYSPSSESVVGIVPEPHGAAAEELRLRVELVVDLESALEPGPFVVEAVE
jgi:hypothetical protein